MTSHDDGQIRLAKLIAQRGLTSRRDAERWIADERVRVNGKIHDGSDPVDPTRDDIVVDGKPLPPEPPKVYYLAFKPRGLVTGRDDPEGRKSVHEMVAHLPFRVEPVGRLDMDTEGALLFTNDGDLAYKLAHPSTEIPKTYLAKVYRRPTNAKLAAIRQGKVFLEDGAALPAKVQIVDQTDAQNTWVEITVTEGRNRLIRRIFQQLHHPVSKLRRESFATLSVRNMERGQVRPLTGAEVRRLRDLAEGVSANQAGKLKRKAGWAKPKVDKGRPQNRKNRLLAKKRKAARRRTGGGT